jgi:DMSO/TMAO reductase YedYZ molybdopterin-dependent catalytic subunit
VRAAILALIVALAPAAGAFAQRGNGAPMPDIDASAWRLEVSGPAVALPFSLGAEELGRMETVGKREQLICPGLYAYMADWEGVPLTALLAMGKTSPEWKEVTFSSADGYVASFTREEADTHLLFIAIRKNGAPLPRQQGFPARVVAVGFTGGRWVRWLTGIEVE